MIIVTNKIWCSNGKSEKDKNSITTKTHHQYTTCSQQNIIQQLTFSTQIQTKTVPDNPRDNNKNDTIQTPTLKSKTIQNIN